MREAVPVAAAQRVNEANALARQGRYAEALMRADDAVSFEPLWGDGHATRGRVLCMLGRWEEAADSFGTAIRLRPDQAAYYNGRGNALFGLHRFVEARTDYLEAVRLAPDDLAPYIPLAICHHALGEADLESGTLSRFTELGGVLPDDYDAAAATTEPQNTSDGPLV
jgi:tetratricopeptide (TPR) repeat protein